MEQKHFYPGGICAVAIHYKLDEDNRIHDLSFQRGCDGNHKAIAALCEGMEAEKVIQCLQGITCGNRPTSCGDQFAKALKKDLGLT